MKKKILSVALAIIMAFMFTPIFVSPASAAPITRRYSTISAGHRHSLAIASDGSLWAWGGNWGGQLGDGTTTDRHYPVRIGMEYDWVHVSAGIDGSLGIRSDGSLWGWGAAGVAGIIDSDAFTNIDDLPRTVHYPVQIGTYFDWVYANAGDNYFGIRSDGSLWGWGISSRGSLGDGTINRGDDWRTIPPVRIGNYSWMHVSSSGSFTLGIRADGTLWAWGDPSATGESGRFWLYPRQISNEQNWMTVRSNSFNAIALQDDGGLYIWSTWHNRLEQYGIFSDWTDVSRPSSGDHILGIRDDGSLWAWGRGPFNNNRDGQLGDGTTTDRRYPVRIGMGYDWVSVSTGFDSSLGLRADGSLWAWGNNSHGRLGDGTTINRYSPVRIMDNVMLPWEGVISPQVPTPPSVDTTHLNAVIISTASELAAIGGEESAGRTYVLANDITLPANWRPIQDFQGTFNGAGHSITISSNLSSTSTLATAGLFESITGGNVVIRNLAVRTSPGITVTAHAPGARNSRAYAGGIIGMVTGGDVTLENVSFDGRVSARSSYDVLMSGISQNADDLMRHVFSMVRDNARDALIDSMVAQGHFPKWFGNLSTTYTIISQVIEAIRNMDELNANGARSYAGGLIGFIGGNANVRIVNSFARGNVSANAGTTIFELSAYIGTVRGRSFAGGLVGFSANTARLSIDNSYVTNSISASAFAHVFGRPDSNAGALVGRGRLENTRGTNYRLTTQSLSADPRGFMGRFVNELFGARLLSENRGNTNTAGITGSLGQAQMQTNSSFAGWDFNTVWMTDASRNNGYPIHRAVERSFLIAAQQPDVKFSAGFVAVTGSDVPLELSVNMPVSSFNGVSVNGVSLTQNVHFTVAGGSTRIELLPVFLNTLEDGFHAVKIAFQDGIIAEEYILISQRHITDETPATRIYHNDVLIFSIEDGLRANENYINLLAQGEHGFRAELLNGHVLEETVYIGEYEIARADLENNTIIIIIGCVIAVIFIGIGAFVIIKARKQKTN